MLSELLEAVLAAPDDDAPRRVYADALLERGDPLGEFIHVQCDLAEGRLSREDGIKRRRRERELLAAHETTWRTGLYGLASEPRFVRGFIDEVTVGAELWSTRGEELFTAAPALRAVMLTDLLERAADHGGPAATQELVMGRFKRAMASPALRRLRGLGHYTVGYGYRETQWETYDITSFGDEVLELLLAAEISQLTSLSINANTKRQIEALAASPLIKKLERLELQLIRAWDPADPAPVLSALEPARLQLLALEEWHEQLSRFTGLQELRIVGGGKAIGALPAGLKRLWIRREKISSEDLAGLSPCTELEQLEMIIGDVSAWRAFEQLPFRQLRHLWIHCRDLALEHWRELRQWPIGANLELLQVAEMSDSDLAQLRELFGCIVEVRR